MTTIDHIFRNSQALFDDFYRQASRDPELQNFSVKDSNKKVVFSAPLDRLEKTNLPGTEQATQTGWNLKNLDTGASYRLNMSDLTSGKVTVINRGVEIGQESAANSALTLADLRDLGGPSAQNNPAPIFDFDHRNVVMNAYWHPDFEKLKPSVAQGIAEVGLKHGVRARDFLLASVIHEVGNGYELEPDMGLGRHDIAVMAGMDARVIMVGLGQKMEANHMKTDGGLVGRAIHEAIDAGGEKVWFDAKVNADSAREAILNQSGDDEELGSDMR